MRLAAALSLVLSLVALAACTTGDPVEAVTREAARSVVRPVVAERLPGPQAEAVTDCVIDNATTSELLALARDFGVEPGTSTVERVLVVVRRPETLGCIAEHGILPFLD